MAHKIYINARFLTQAITGVQQYARELVRGLDLMIDRGEIDKSEYTFIMLAPSRGVTNDLVLKHITIRRVGLLTGHAWEQAELPLYSGDGLLFCPGNTAPVLSLLSSRKIVTTVHSLAYLYFPEAYSRSFRAFYNLIIPLIMKKADVTITVSQSEKDMILSRYPFASQRLHMVQNGGMSIEFMEEMRTSDIYEEKTSYPFILFVGSLSRGKNLQAVVKAISFLEKELHLVVVGATGKTFADAGVEIPDSSSRRIDFKGQINNNRELINLYKTALCLVFPSFYESSGLPPIEAMACGCPVVASSIPALIERCGDAAVYCNPASPADIAGKVRMLLDDGALRAALKEKGLQRSRQFSWEKCARETWEVIKGVL